MLVAGHRSASLGGYRSGVAVDKDYHDLTLPELEHLCQLRKIVLPSPAASMSPEFLAAFLAAFDTGAAATGFRRPEPRRQVPHFLEDSPDDGVVSEDDGVVGRRADEDGRVEDADGRVEAEDEDDAPRPNSRQRPSPKSSAKILGDGESPKAAPTSTQKPQASPSSFPKKAPGNNSRASPVSRRTSGSPAEEVLQSLREVQNGCIGVDIGGTLAKMVLMVDEDMSCWNRGYVVWGAGRELAWFW